MVTNSDVMVKISDETDRSALMERLQRVARFPSCQITRNNSEYNHCGKLR